jgi:multidrug resistance efflux pump
MRAEYFLRKRFARLALAISFILVAGWAFLPYVTHRVGASAFVNSTLVRVTAPISGRLSPHLPRQGDLIDSSKSLNLIEALSPDRRHLLDLQLQSSLAKKAAELANHQLDELAVFDAQLAKRAEAYKAAVVDQIGHEVLEAQAEHVGCVAELKQRSAIGSSFDTLTQSKVVSPVRSAEAHAIEQAASTRCDVAAAKLARLRDELQTATNGVFVRGGTNDVPYSQQQRDQLLLHRQTLEAEALHESARSSQLAAEIGAEKARVAKLDNYHLALPEGYVVWSTAASPGSAVTEGQTILDLADCKHRFVAVELPERDFESIKIGDNADLRLVGSDEWRRGQVQQVRASAARADDRLFAAKVPRPGPATISVEVSLAQDAAQVGGGNFCGIGRLAEVRFRRSWPDLTTLVSTGWHWLAGTSDGQIASTARAGS